MCVCMWGVENKRGGEEGCESVKEKREREEEKKKERGRRKQSEK